MKNLATVLLALSALSCTAERPRVVEQVLEPFTSCPKITASTPWNLDARQGVDFWSCTYTYAVTGKPLFKVYLGNHPTVPPVVLHGHYPTLSDHLWFREVSTGNVDQESYWLFQQGGTRELSLLAVELQAAGQVEFEEKAAAAISLAP